MNRGMMKKTALSLWMVLLAAVLLLPAAAHADTINFVLSNSTLAGSAGSTLTFDATVSAPSTNTSTVFLDSDSFTIAGPFTLDDSHFFNDFPLSLDPTDSFTGSLFTVFIPLGTPAGLYSGSSFQILFSDAAGASDLASQNFAVQVTDTSAVPEPETWVLLMTGVGMLPLGLYGRRMVGSARAA
jgi:hypothetical protein